MIFNKGLIKSTMAFPVLVCASMFYSISSQAVTTPTGTQQLSLMVTAEIPPLPSAVTTFTASFIGPNTVLLTDPYHTGRLTGNDFQIEMIGGEGGTPTAPDKSVNVSYTVAGLPSTMTAKVLINGKTISDGKSGSPTKFSITAKKSNYFTGNIVLTGYENTAVQSGIKSDIHAQVTLNLAAQSS